ncbi:polynucleotide 3'-phosphatase ZDP isoform X2 [Impatiens glandulifera]|uniref:polynucleotide 3'-phosphatase ZDP isoform X2 n=1 Tax=Impatiens glandulifera TaxID=253017 RepID=UPI001FB0B0FC|nr:polynucleotide 3'-phosphatase ZDP isoform X2 [Impatiens glandulifera]
MPSTLCKFGPFSLSLISYRLSTTPLLLPLLMAPPKVIAEYAKSGRSSCKKCTKAISTASLRLGLVTKDPRGFGLTKWHHLDCFPVASNEISSPDSISGFSSLKSSDQESLKRLLAGGDCSTKMVSAEDETEIAEQNDENSKKRKVSAGEIVESSEQSVEISKRRKDPITDGHDAIEGSEQKDSVDQTACLVKYGDEADIALSVTEIKDVYKDAILPPKWKAFQTIIFLERDDGLKDSSKIAAFDFDGCVAKTSVRKVGPDAWSLMYPSIPEKFQSLYNDGYKLVIFTNESNIDRWKNKRQVAVDSKIGRLCSFIKSVNVPVQVYIACGVGNSQVEDKFRKPKIGMWHIMKQHFNSNIQIDMDRSFYVGDAAGRINDHSAADIEFAKGIGLKFYVPEDYFET